MTDELPTLLASVAKDNTQQPSAEGILTIEAMT